MSDEKNYNNNEVEPNNENQSERALMRGITADSMEARRKLEDALEQRRLQKAIQDYDFDLD